MGSHLDEGECAGVYVGAVLAEPAVVHLAGLAVGDVVGVHGSPLSQGPPILPFQARDQAGHVLPRARGSERVNRPAIRSCTRSNSATTRSTTTTP